jgi:hypothetical protein
VVYLEPVVIKSPDGTSARIERLVVPVTEPAPSLLQLLKGPTGEIVARAYAHEHASVNATDPEQRHHLQQIVELTRGISREERATLMRTGVLEQAWVDLGTGEYLDALFPGPQGPSSAATLAKSSSWLPGPDGR